jgi:hypothetical protein
MSILLVPPISQGPSRPAGRIASWLVRGLLMISSLAALVLPEAAAAQWSANPRLYEAMRMPVPQATARVAMAPTPMPAPAQDDVCVTWRGIRQQDEIVMVNTRPACCTTNPDKLAARIHLETYAIVDASGRRRWQPYDMASLQAADPSMTTVIFVHGNQIGPGEDCQTGMDVYRRLVRCHCSDDPIRFVIFSWPASKIAGPLQDVRIKAARTRPVGWEFAWFVDELPGQTPMGLIGYSFGARIITGGLHILGGGNLNGLGLDERVHPDRAPVRVVLIAAALNSNWLGPNQYHGDAMSQVDQMLLLNNCEDLAMRYYRFSTTCGDPQALGLCGPTYLAPQDRAKICNRDLSSYDGSRHDLMRYISAPGTINQTWHYVTFEEVGCRPTR